MIQRLQDSRAILLGAVGIFSFGLIASGYLLGDGLRRAKMAERSVTVRGVSERDVTADLATWSVSFSEEGTNLEPVQASVDARSRAVRASKSAALARSTLKRTTRSRPSISIPSGN